MKSKTVRRATGLSTCLILLVAPLTSQPAPSPSGGGATGPEAVGTLPALRWLCEDLPPANYLDGGKLKGASAELLTLLWKEVGLENQHVDVVPWARGYGDALSVSGTVLFSMSRTAEREALFKWVGPIFVARHVAVCLADSTFSAASLADLKNLRVGTVRDDINEQDLLRSGVSRSAIVPLASLAQNLVMLDAGHIDCFVNSEDAIRRYSSEHSLDPAKYRVLYVLSEYPNFFAFNKATDDRVVARFQAALDRVRPEHERILARYGMGL